MTIDRIIAAYMDAKARKLAAEKEEKALAAQILEHAKDSTFFETDDFRVMITARTRTDIDTAALVADFPTIKAEYPRPVSWKEIKPQALTDAEKAARRRPA